jgi:hypothetical protein
MQIVVTLFAIVIFAFSGLAVWASSERPLALREIAMNTRREGAGGSDYVFLRIQSSLLKVLAVIVWNVGLLLVIFVNLSDALPFV